MTCTAHPAARAVAVTDALVSARGVGVVAGRHRILRDVDFSIGSGEIVTFVGPNGSGKTTLLRVLIGARSASEGRVARRPGLRIGYVPQRLALDGAMPLTVDRFLALGGGDRAARAAALDRVGTPRLAGVQMTDLSGGQTQRALLAHALLRRPDLLALDEPTQGLDQPGIAAFYQLIETLRAELGVAILLVSHDLHVVMSAADRVVCLNGHVCCEGTPTVVSGTPEYRALFGLGTRGALALYRHEHDHSHGAEPAASQASAHGTGGGA
jgi:zinc transport system ATP-binding protein